MQILTLSQRTLVVRAGLALVFLASLEVAARVDDWVMRGVPLFVNYNMEQLFLDGPLGTTGRPGARYARWGIGPDGFRGPAVQPQTGQARIVTYGASETFGIYEDEGKEYPRQLEQLLNARHTTPRFEVLNMALPGMRVGSGVRYLQEVLRRYPARYVLIYPTATHYIGVTRPYCGRPVRTPTAQTGWGRPDWRIAERSRDVIKTLLPQRLQTALRKASIAWSRRGHPALAAVPEPSLAAFESDLRCALAAIRMAPGAEPVLVTHARRFSHAAQPDDEDWLTAWRQQYPELEQGGFQLLERQANEIVRRVAGELGTRLVDADAALSGHPDLFGDYSHFNNTGAARMAALLVQELGRAPP